jgi:hypothetical protein
MKRVKTIIGLAVVLIIGCILISMLRHERMPQTVLSQVTAPPAPDLAQSKPQPPPAEATPQPQAPSGSKKQWQDPEARVALSLVGVLPEAEQYWSLAINNPDLPAKERQDLIEDLNEEGFRDPKNLRAEDLPLILSRIKLIEELAPKAMDTVNAEAFKEAHKDLVSMAARLRP